MTKHRLPGGMKIGLAIGALIVIGAAAAMLPDVSKRRATTAAARIADHDLPRTRQGALRRAGESSWSAIRALLPHEIYIPNGRYTAYSLGLVADAVLSRGAEQSLPLAIRRPISTWGEYPIPLCIDTLPTSGIRPQAIGFLDLVAEAAREFNGIVGDEIFGAVNACTAQPRRSESFEGVMVRLSGPTGADGSESAFAATHRSTRCVITADADGSCLVAQIRRAEIEVRAGDRPTLLEYRGGGVVQHELLHALGLSHTCVVPSLLFADFGEGLLRRCPAQAASWGYPPPRQTSRPSPYDVAHLLVLRALKEQLWPTAEGSGGSR